MDLEITFEFNYYLTIVSLKIKSLESIILDSLQAGGIHRPSHVLRANVSFKISFSFISHINIPFTYFPVNLLMH